MRGVIILRSRRRYPARRRFLLGLLLILVALLLMFFSTLHRLTPIIHDMALASVKNAVTAAVNNAIGEKLSSGELEYTDLVRLEKDNDGRVTALMTDMSSINMLKADLTRAIVDQISKTRRNELSVPIGNLIGGNLLSGRGPRIPVRIISVAYAGTEFKNAFESTGINQTRHRIIIEANVTVAVLIPNLKTSTSIKTEVTVAETVIVGSVPDSYTYFESDTKWDENLEQFDILN